MCRISALFSIGLQDRCGAVFLQLANASCILEELRKEEKKASRTAAGGSKAKPIRLHTAHALSMDVILSIGLEMGSHSSDCWKHVFRYCSKETNTNQSRKNQY